MMCPLNRVNSNRDKAASLDVGATPRRSTSSLDDVTPASNRPLYLIAAVAIATMTSGYAVCRYLNGVVPGDGVFRLYGIVTAILVVSWLVTDPAIPSKQRPSFDHGMLVWVTFPFLAVYHMYFSPPLAGVSNGFGVAWAHCRAQHSACPCSSRRLTIGSSDRGPRLR